MLEQPTAAHSSDVVFGGSQCVMIVDDHPLFRRGLVEAVQVACPQHETLEAGSLSGALDVLRRRRDIDLVLLDLRLPDCADFGGLRVVRERFPMIPVAVISANEEHAVAHRALKLGAMGFIPKSAQMPVLRKALSEILSGHVWIGESAAPPRRTWLDEAGLTPAQMRVISSLGRGLLNKQIAFELGLTEHTVKAHMTAAFRKLGVDNRLQVMVMLRESGHPEGIA